MKHFYIYILLVLISLPPLVHSQEYAFVSTADTTSLMNSVTYIDNDNEMNVWIGYKLDATTFVPKVAKWDGEELYIYSANDNLEFGVVRSVLPSREGNHIWLATATGLRKLNSDGTYKDYPLPQNGDGFRIIDDGQFTNMVENANGDVYCSTNLYPQKDIYNSDSKLLRDEPEVWALIGENWVKTEIRTSGNTVSYQLHSDSDGKILLTYYDISPGNQGTKLIEINTLNNNEVQYDIESPLDSKISVRPASITSNNEEVVLSFRPNESSVIFEGFSLFNRNSEVWEHFTSAWYVSRNPDLDLIPIPSAVKMENGKYFPLTNWAYTITPDKKNGYWFSMLSDHKADWLVEKGGGLLYFDGNKSFVRYSSDTHEGIRPFRPNPDLTHSSDGQDISDVQWRFGTGVAYDKNGDLFVGNLIGGLWIIPENQLPTVSSVEELQAKKGFIVVPNLVNSGSTFDIKLGPDFEGDISAIYISDQTGRMVSSLSSKQLSSTRKLTINTDGMTTGMYFVNITVNGENSTEKFIIR